jgi:hypothetical protein
MLQDHAEGSYHTTPRFSIARTHIPRYGERAQNQNANMNSSLALNGVQEKIYDFAPDPHVELGLEFGSSVVKTDLP